MRLPNAALDWSEPSVSASANSTPVIELLGVGKTFAGRTPSALPVLEGIDLSLQSGEIVGLLGRSGSGKSTLLRIAGGLTTPSMGQVRYQGRRLTGPSEGISIV